MKILISVIAANGGTSCLVHGSIPVLIHIGLVAFRFVSPFNKCNNLETASYTYFTYLKLPWEQKLAQLVDILYQIKSKELQPVSITDNQHIAVLFYKMVIAHLTSK